MQFSALVSYAEEYAEEYSKIEGLNSFRYRLPEVPAKASLREAAVTARLMVENPALTSENLTDDLLHVKRIIEEPCAADTLKVMFVRPEITNEARKMAVRDVLFRPLIDAVKASGKMDGKEISRALERMFAFLSDEVFSEVS